MLNCRREQACVCVRQLELHGEAVQCGACEIFFHGECVGFKELADMPGEDDDWFCPACQPKPAPADRNPWTLQDIVSCKDIPFTEVLKDFQSLVDFNADTNPKKMCGNKTLYYYQFRNLLKCKREGKSAKTIEEIYADPVLIEQLWQATINRNRNKKHPGGRAVDVYETHRINTGAIVFFKSSTAKFIYKKFHARSVLDFTAGWGGRMLGAMSLGIQYTGVDTNLNLKLAYDRMMNELPVANKDDYRMIWESCLEVDFSILDYDFILTSPPYVNMELWA